MSSNRTIARNTIFLYFRMLVVMGTSLYTVRIVLHSLGVQDFGLYGVAAGLVTLFAFLNGAMSQAAQRFLSVELGRGSPDGLRDTFSAILMIHVLIAIAVVLIAETAGLWLLQSKMTIPADREHATNLAYHFAVASGVAMIIQTPYNALIISRERMWFFSIVSLLEAALRLTIAWGISHVAGDRLSAYSAMLFGASIATLASYIIFSRLHFKESRLKIHRKREIYGSLGGFIGWSFIGNLAGAGRSQGINVLLNIFFGPAANAAHAVMTQAQTAANNFANSFQMAINPQIYQRHARNELDSMRALIIFGSKANFLLLLIVVAPTLNAIDYILHFWLETPPALAASFIAWMLVTLLIDSISQPLITAAMATGRIKAYQIVVGGTIIISVPATYIAFQATQSPESFLAIMVATSIMTLALRLVFLKKMLDFPMSQFFIQVIMRAIVAALSIYAFACVYRLLFGSVSTLTELVQASSALASIAAATALLIGLTSSERAHLFSKIMLKISR